MKKSESKKHNQQKAAGKNPTRTCMYMYVQLLLTWMFMIGLRPVTTNAAKVVMDVTA